MKKSPNRYKEALDYILQDYDLYSFPLLVGISNRNVHNNRERHVVKNSGKFMKSMISS